MPTLWTAIITHLLADETLRNLVHDRICYGTPRFAIDTFPAVRLLLLSDIPNPHIPGDSESRLQIDVTAASAAAAWPVARRIEELLRYPTREHPVPMECETCWLRVATPGQTVQLLSQRDNPAGGGKLVQLTTDWTLRVTKKE